ncbi:hypothetical protein DSO57_1001229 [Entomophthora muscae]|uniref:Uncharacterized protein n=1 Tax=Entomophthora muscae TaxID=34485 RepID=A0ACC2SLU9_9FUNG|nr:hypothetical protein DSO57_1001229 [Entomophthora muscae]
MVMDSGMSKSFFQFNSLEYKGTNLFSLVCAVAVVAYIVWLRIKKPAYVNRVSLKLQAGIAFFDIIRHLNNIFNYTANEDGCKFLGFLFFFTYHLNTFLNVAIAVNLQLVFLLERALSERLRPLLYVIPVLGALLIDIFPFVFSGYGKSYISFCHVNFVHPSREAIKALVLYTTNYPAIIYCMVIAMAVFIKLARTKPACDLEAQSLLPTIHDPMSRALACRVALYPLACFLCHIGDLICNLLVFFSISPYGFVTLAYMGVSLNGAANLVCFLLDPYIVESFYRHPAAPLDDLELDLAPQKFPDQIKPCPSFASESRAYISLDAKDSEAFWNQF